MDVAFLIDRTPSLSVGDLELEKGFVAELVGALNVSPDATHVGIIMFDKEGEVIADFKDESLYSKEALYELIERIPNFRRKPTRTDIALMTANNWLFTPEGGDRPKFPNALIILTDGKTNPVSKPSFEIIPLLKVSLRND